MTSTLRDGLTVGDNGGFKEVDTTSRRSLVEVDSLKESRAVDRRMDDRGFSRTSEVEGCARRELIAN